MGMAVPEKMVAVQLESNGGPLSVRQVPVRRAGPGDVLVRMAASPINPSDLAFLAGDYAIKKPFPVVPGLERSGMVVDAGRGLIPRMWDTQRINRFTTTALQTTVQKRLPLSAVQEALEIYRRNMTAGKVLLVANPAEVPLG